MNYLLTEDAESDMRGIIRYTRQAWGADQVRIYAATLEAGITRLAAGEGPFKKLDAIYPALRMARCGHYYIFCLPRETAPSLIVAILHEPMDLMVRLAERFNDLP